MKYALPAGRKSDPDFDMNTFRLSVAAIMDGTAPAAILISAVEPVTDPGAAPGRATLRSGATGELVKQVQQKFGWPYVDGIFGAKTEAAVRVLQRDHGLAPDDGIVGPKTWAVLDAA